jgi:hypothetical protein
MRASDSIDMGESLNIIYKGCIVAKVKLPMRRRIKTLASKNMNKKEVEDDSFHFHGCFLN